MTLILGLSNVVLSALLVLVVVSNTRKVRKLTSQLEDMNVEQSKVNFRLFVVEKRQKISNER